MEKLVFVCSQRERKESDSHIPLEIPLNISPLLPTSLFVDLGPFFWGWFLLWQCCGLYGSLTKIAQIFLLVLVIQHHNFHFLFHLK